MDSARRKALRDAYKAKPAVGGVCCIRCAGNQWVCIQATRDIEGLKNRFAFAMATGTAPDPTLRGEWEKYGAESFSFTVLDELKMGEDQTPEAFKEDIDALYEIWLEKSRQGDLR